MMSQLTFEIEFSDPTPDTFELLVGGWAEHFGGDLDAAGTMGGPVALVTAHLYRQLDPVEVAAALATFQSVTADLGLHVISLRVLATEDGHLDEEVRPARPETA